MDSIQKFRKYFAVVIRWVARILGGLLAILVLVIFVGESLVGEGPGNPFKHPLPVQLGFVGMLAMWVGCIVGWKWQGVGALLTIGGIMTFHIIEKRLWLMGAFPLFDLAGILFLLCWLLKKKRDSRLVIERNKDK